MSNPGIYALKLEGDNYYVGKSNNSIQDRIERHFNGGGAEWTKLHKPIEVEGVLEVSEDMSPSKLNRYERWMTKSMMMEFGWESVRGGGWVQTEMEESPIS